MTRYEIRPFEICKFNRPTLSHGNLILGVGFLNEPDTLVTASADGTTSVWSIASFAEVQRFREGEISSFSYGENQWVVSTGVFNGTVHVRKGVTGNTVFKLNVQGPGPKATHIPRSGKIILMAVDGAILIYDLNTASRINTYVTGQRFINAIATTSDGTQIATVGDGVKLWKGYRNAASPTSTNLSRDDSFLTAAISPDSCLIAAGGDGFFVYDLINRRKVFEHASRTDAVCFTPDGTTLITGGNAGAYIWRISDFKLLYYVDFDTRAVATSPDSLVCALAGTADVCLLDLRNFGLTRRGYAIVGAFLLDDETVLEVCSDNKIRLCETSARRLVEYDIPNTASTGGNCGNDAVALLDNHKLTCTVVRICDGSILWTTSGTDACFSQSGPLTAVVNRNSLHIFDSRDGAELASLAAGTKRLRCPLFSYSGDLLVAASYDGITRVWDAATYQQLGALDSGETLALAFSPDSRWLASGGTDGFVRIWSLAESFGHESSKMRLRTWPTAMTFLRDDLLLVGDLQGSLSLLNLSTKQIVSEYEAHQWRIAQIALSPSRTRFVTSSYDGSVVLWGFGAE